MGGNLYLYVSAFLSHWWPLVTAGSLLGVEEFAERYWPWAQERLVKIGARWRKGAPIVALLVASLYSGYLAWSDEHTALIDAQTKLIQREDNQQQIDKLKSQVSELQRERDDTNRYRRLTDGQKQTLRSALCGNIKKMRINAYTVPEAYRYFTDISEPLDNCGIVLQFEPDWVYLPFPKSPQELGLHMDVPDPYRLSEDAERVFNAFRAAGIDIDLRKNNIKEDFIVVVGPLHM